MSTEDYDYFRQYWDCDHCNNQNLAPFVRCKACGAGQSPNVQFYGRVPTNDPEVIRIAESGPNMICEYCSANTNSGEACGNCGGDLGGAAPLPNAKRNTRKPRTDSSRDSSNRTRTPAEPVWSATSSSSYSTEQQWTSSPASRFAKFGALGTVGIIGLIAVGVISLIALFYYLTRTHEVNAQVIGFNWTRVITLERRDTETGSDWEDKVPSDAHTTSCREKKFKDAEKVQTGTKEVDSTDCPEEDLGNGVIRKPKKCKKEVPTYGMKPAEYKDFCQWEREVWVNSREIPASGTDKNPYWPNYQLGYDEREKYNGRTETYRLLFQDKDGKQYTYGTKDQNTWQRLQPGSWCTLTINTVFDSVTGVKEQDNSF